MEHKILLIVHKYKTVVSYLASLGVGIGIIFVPVKFLFKTEGAKTIIKTSQNNMKTCFIGKFILGLYIKAYIAHIKSIIRTTEFNYIVENAIPMANKLIQSFKKEIYPESYFDILLLIGHCNQTLGNILEEHYNEDNNIENIKNAKRNYEKAKMYYLAAMRFLVNAPKFNEKLRRQKYVDSLLYCNKADGKVKKTSAKIK